MDGFRWDDDPIRLFRDWHRAAARLVGAAADAMTLATATPDGRPSARVVLLKGVDEGRFCFFSNAFSRKGTELSLNARVASVFFWPQAQRQVRVEGRVRALPREKAEAYFHTRPLESRLSSHVSPQSRVIATEPGWVGRARLKEKARALGVMFGQRPPVPAHWSGWAIDPASIEFWQSGEARLHYRLRFDRARGGWRRSELAP